MKKITLLLSLFLVYLLGWSQTFEPLWEYSSKKGNLDQVYESDIKNGFDYYDGELFLAARRDGNTQIVIYDAATGLPKMDGENVRQLPSAGFSMGWSGGEVAIDSNGSIYCIPSSGTTIFKWENSTATPTAFAQVSKSGIWGLASYVDAGGNGCLIAPVADQDLIYYIPVINNVAGDIITLTLDKAFGTAPRAHIIDSKTFWVYSTNTLPIKVTLDDDFNVLSQSTLNIDASIVNPETNGLAQFTYKEKTYLIIAANSYRNYQDVPKHSAAIFEFDPVEFSVSQIGDYLPVEGMGDLTTNAAHFVKPVVDVTSEGVYIYLMAGFNGIAAYKFDVLTPEPVNPLFTFENDKVTKEIGTETFINPLKTETDGEITYSSSNQTVATVDETGLVTVLSLGSTIITASASASENYNAATTSYELVIELVTPEFKYENTTIQKLTIDESFTNLLTNNSDGVVTYESSNESVATVNGDGLVTILTEGTTIIKALVTATETYKAAEASYELTITKPELIDPDFKYEQITIEKLDTDEPFTNLLTNNSDGVVNYESSNESVATVGEDGLVTILAEGTTIIKASVIATETYKAADASYTLTVKKDLTDIDRLNSSSVVIRSLNDAIQIEFEGEANIEVYTINGMKIVSDIAENEYTIALSKGMYIVKVNGVSYKVIK